MVILKSESKLRRSIQKVSCKNLLISWFFSDTEFKPILIYIVAAGSFTIMFTIIVFVISRRRKRYINNNRIQSENDSADLQRENEQIEQYSTIL